MKPLNARRGRTAKMMDRHDTSDEVPFWESTPLSRMTPTQWESLCDGCGLCCMEKLEDAETGAIYITSVACQYLDPGELCLQTGPGGALPARVAPPPLRQRQADEEGRRYGLRSGRLRRVHPPR